jgi:LPS export ABC transporter protein LptC
MKFASSLDRRSAAPFLAGRRRLPLVLGILWLALVGPSAAVADDESKTPVNLILSGMTYVASEGATNELVLDADRARLPSPGDQAHLEGVRARFGSKAPGGASTDASGGLDLVCDVGVFDLESRDFIAEGNVRGTTADGRRFRTDGLRYNHEEGRVSTERPVVIRDEAGTYRGGGFDYYVREDRFRLRGGARVEQAGP